MVQRASTVKPGFAFVSAKRGLVVLVESRDVGVIYCRQIVPECGRTRSRGASRRGGRRPCDPCCHRPGYPAATRTGCRWWPTSAPRTIAGGLEGADDVRNWRARTVAAPVPALARRRSTPQKLPANKPAKNTQHCQCPLNQPPAAKAAAEEKAAAKAAAKTAAAEEKAAAEEAFRQRQAASLEAFRQQQAAAEEKAEEKAAAEEKAVKRQRR